MTALLLGVAGLTPDAQLVLTICVLVVIIVVATSPTAKQNLLALFKFFRDNPPPVPPEDAA